MKHYQLFKYTTNREVFVFPKFFRQTNDNEKKMCYTLLSIIKMQQNANRRNEENRNSIKGLNMIYYKLYN